MANPLLQSGKSPGIPDPFGSMQGMIGQLQGFMANPVQYMIQRKLNIPQNLINDPQAAVQHLIDSGAMSQQQFNALQKAAQQIQANPQFMRMFGGKK